MGRITDSLRKNPRRVSNGLALTLMALMVGCMAAGAGCFVKGFRKETVYKFSGGTEIDRKEQTVHEKNYLIAGSVCVAVSLVVMVVAVVVINRRCNGAPAESSGG